MATSFPQPVFNGSADIKTESGLTTHVCIKKDGTIFINGDMYVPAKTSDISATLSDMMATQAGFELTQYPDFYQYTFEERTAFIKEHSLHLNQEINEMLYELPYFKPWKDYAGMDTEAKQVAFAAARKEMIDAWHFFMNIMLALGFSAEEFIAMYFEKNKINYQRQKDGYTFDKSYREENQ